MVPSLLHAERLCGSSRGWKSNKLNVLLGSRPANVRRLGAGPENASLECRIAQKRSAQAPPSGSRRLVARPLWLVTTLSRRLSNGESRFGRRGTTKPVPTCDDRGSRSAVRRAVQCVKASPGSLSTLGWIRELGSGTLGSCPWQSVHRSGLGPRMHPGGKPRPLPITTVDVRPSLRQGVESRIRSTSQTAHAVMGLHKEYRTRCDGEMGPPIGTWPLLTLHDSVASVPPFHLADVVPIGESVSPPVPCPRIRIHPYHSLAAKWRRSAGLDPGAAVEAALITLVSLR